MVLVAGMGDDGQAMKAGIMEIGDIFAINKADREGVLRTEKEVEALLSLVMREDGCEPPIVKTVAIESRRIDELASAIDRCSEAQQQTVTTGSRRQAIARWRILE